MPRRPGEKFLRNKQRKAKTKQYKEYDKQRGSSTQRGYDRRWSKTRTVKLEDGPLCEMCEAEGRLTPATEVHHIKPIADGGDINAYSNLMSLCHACHMKLHAGDIKQ